MKPNTIQALHEIRLTVVQIAIPIGIITGIILCSDKFQDWWKEHKDKKQKKKMEKDVIDATWTTK